MDLALACFRFCGIAEERRQRGRMRGIFGKTPALLDSSFYLFSCPVFAGLRIREVYIWVPKTRMARLSKDSNRLTHRSKRSLKLPQERRYGCCRTRESVLDIAVVSEASD